MLPAMDIRKGEGFIVINGKLIGFAVWQAEIRQNGQVDLVGHCSLFPGESYVDDNYRARKAKEAFENAANTPLED